jgi:lytic murein transglycosylase
MDRRAFLFSTAWLAIAPAPDMVRDAVGLGGALPAGLPQTQDTLFDAWRSAFLQAAVDQGLPLDQVKAALLGVTPDPDVIARDHRQPEFSKPISAYLATTVSAQRIADGQAHLTAARPWLDPIVVSYQTPASVLVSIWAIESGFGLYQGQDDVIRSMATLAAEGRRRAFAESELIGALRILISGEASRGELKGSWAGAMGQTQFTPLDYLAYAVDADGDGRRDIWGSAPDALGSTANFLMKKAKWRPGESAQIEVFAPRVGFDYALLEGPAQTLDAWAEVGVRPADPRTVKPADASAPASLIMPMGWRGPAFLALTNHAAIKAYNNSTAYALGVGLLAEAIAGGPGLTQPWPADQPIALDDRIAAQASLKAQGFYEGDADGLFGTATRRAARLWQASRGLPADGYLSYDLVQRLKAEAPLAVSPPGPPPQAGAPWPGTA